MICGIGIDSVEIKRFADWHTYSHHKLTRVFSDDEIAYCLSSDAKSAERFAVRFAAKEALFKVLAKTGVTIPLLYICKHASIMKEHNNSPVFVLNDALNCQLPIKSVIHVSLTHTKQYATAFVVIERF